MVSPRPPAARPTPLRFATAVTCLQGLALALFGAWLGYESVVATASNRQVAQGSTAYFLVLGVLVLVIAAALWRRRRWSLGAGVFVQLIGLLVAVTMAQGRFLAGAVPLAVASMAALVALLQQSSRTALGRN